MEVMRFESAARPVRRMHASGQLVVVEMAKAERTAARCLWPGKIPLGKLTLLAGNPVAASLLRVVKPISRAISLRVIAQRNGSRPIAQSQITESAELA